MYCIDSGIYGAIVGDALGLPVQFIPRDERDADPVTDMRGHGAFDMPAGSWSDDSSLILATTDGLTGSLRKADYRENLNDIIDYELIMNNFSLWLNEGQFTPYGFAYDIGGATMDGIRRYDRGSEAILSGGIGERDNGNGSLMRILPIAFFIYCLSQKHSFDEDEKMTAVHNLSSLTHRHKRSQMTCGIYVTIALEFIENHEKGLGLGLEELIANGINKSRVYYENNTSFEKELHHFERVFSLNIKTFHVMKSKAEDILFLPLKHPFGVFAGMIIIGIPCLRQSILDMIQIPQLALLEDLQGFTMVMRTFQQIG